MFGNFSRSPYSDADVVERVLLQQGSPIYESDINEQMAAVLERLRMSINAAVGWHGAIGQENGFRFLSENGQNLDENKFSNFQIAAGEYAINGAVCVLRETKKLLSPRLEPSKHYNILLESQEAVLDNDPYVATAAIRTHRKWRILACPLGGAPDVHLPYMQSLFENPSVCEDFALSADENRAGKAASVTNFAKTKSLDLVQHGIVTFANDAIEAGIKTQRYNRCIAVHSVRITNPEEALVNQSEEMWLKECDLNAAFFIEAKGELSADVDTLIFQTMTSPSALQDAKIKAIQFRARGAVEVFALVKTISFNAGTVTATIEKLQVLPTSENTGIVEITSSESTTDSIVKTRVSLWGDVWKVSRKILPVGNEDKWVTDVSMPGNSEEAHRKRLQLTGRCAKGDFWLISTEETSDGRCVLLPMGRTTVQSHAKKQFAVLGYVEAGVDQKFHEKLSDTLMGWHSSNKMIASSQLMRVHTSVDAAIAIATPSRRGQDVTNESEEKDDETKRSSLSDISARILSDAGRSALKQYFTTPKEVLRRIPARYLKTTVSYSPLAKWLAPALLSEIADMSFEDFTKEFQEVHLIPNADWAVFEREAKDVLEKAQHFSRMMASNAGMQSLLS